MSDYKMKIKKYVYNRTPKLFYVLKRGKSHLKGTKIYSEELKRRYMRVKPLQCQKEEFEKKLKSDCKIVFGKNKAYSFLKLVQALQLDNPESEKTDRFFYSIDVFKTWHNDYRLMGNSTIDYKRILDGSINDLALEGESEFAKQSNVIVNALKIYLEKSVKCVKKHKYENEQDICKWLSAMESKKAENFEEGLQRILFVNMLLWQTTHRLVGLGRLDFLLNDLYYSDISAGHLTYNKALDIIKDFLKILHRYYWFKSDALLGDTGQIIILGGKNQDGSYFSNDLTYLFIQAIEELAIPDPKILLRIGNSVPQKLIKKAVECIATGIGCPLLANDEKIIPHMINFGYDEEDAYNYVTSACWEPLVPAVSHEQNNISLYNFLLPIQMIMEKEQYAKISSFEEFLHKYLQHLEGHIIFMNNLLDDIVWEKDPIVSLFTQACRDNKKDISEGGGKYNNYGVLTVAMSNAVNALLIIKKYVYEQSMFDLCDLQYIVENNFKSHEDIRNFLQQQKFYGTDNKEAIRLTNLILKKSNDVVSKYRNCFNGKIKFGLSSPGYIEAAQNFPGSIDGRKYGDPFAVHISGDNNTALTELMEFASKIDYGNAKFNGNVVDFFVSPALIQENIEKFAEFLYSSMKMGVFQIQLNVISSDKLIKAKENPKEYSDLIVRVWGFSAYFVDLPDEYKNCLIERALKSEGKL